MNKNTRNCLKKRYSTCLVLKTTRKLRTGKLRINL